MCYPKPGPRCASHLNDDITRVTAELRTLDLIEQDALTPQQKKDWMDAHNKLDDLHRQYDGTETGQQKLDDDITHAPNRTTQDYLVNRKMIAKEAYDNKIKALKLQESAKKVDQENKVLYLQGKEGELAQNLLKHTPLDPKETPASRRQMERNAVLNFQAEIEPYNTAISQLSSTPIVRTHATPKGYFVVSGKSNIGSGQTHFVFKGNPADVQKAKLLGHVKVSISPNWDIRAEAYRGSGVVGGERFNGQTSHADYFQAVIDPNHTSPARERFDFDALSRADWVDQDRRAAAKPGRRRLSATASR